MTSPSERCVAQQALLLVFLAVALFASPASAASYELFRIERSTNRNVVRFDARAGSDGMLDALEPISAYWVLYEDKGRREGLTWLERQLAYGFSADREADGVRLILVAFDRRVIRVRRGVGGFRAEVSIAGRPAVLRRIWVEVKESLLGPSVRWVDLHGVDESTGKPLVERVVGGSGNGTGSASRDRRN